MPTYVYRCRKGHTFELFHSMTDEAPKRCPKCRSLARRVPAGGSGLLFKGSGFYATDYRSADYEKRAKKDVAAGPEPPAGGSPAPASPAAGSSPSAPADRAPGRSGDRGSRGAGSGPAGGEPRGSSHRAPRGSSRKSEA